MNLGLFMRVLWRLVLCGLVVFAFGFLHFYLPSKDVVRVVGTDVKRMDVRSQEMVKEGAGSAGGPTRDVRFINTVWPDGKPRVYRNEETEWGFPWYFKFDSANLQTKAQDMVSSAAAPKWVTEIGRAHV